MDKGGSESRMTRVSFMATVFALFLAASTMGLISDRLQQGSEADSFNVKIGEFQMLLFEISLQQMDI